MELDTVADMFKTKCIGSKLFDAKCTGFACLLKALPVYFRSKEKDCMVMGAKNG